MSKNKRNNKKKRVYIIVLACEVVILAGLACFLVPKFISGDFFKKKDLPAAQMIPDGEGIVKYDNGDVTYQPPVKNMEYDEDSSIIYYNNTLLVFPDGGIDASVCSELAEKVDGELCGYISGMVNMFQIRVADCSLDELNEKADILMRESGISYACYDFPFAVSDTTAVADNTPERSYDNGTWWYDAIGIDEAWKEYDKLDDADVFPVGITDFGFNRKHEALSSKIHLPENFQANKITLSHGTCVAGITAGQYEDFRGVSYNSELWCIDLISYGDAVADLEISSQSSFFEMNKALLEKNVRVINNSWAGYTYYKSAEEFASDLIDEEREKEDGNPNIKKMNAKTAKKKMTEAIEKNGGFEAYQQYGEKYEKASAFMVMKLISDLVKSGNENFIFVQSAGNSAVETYHSAYFDAITKDIYSYWNELSNDKLEELFLPYDELREHIVVVGSVGIGRDKAGHYIASNFSNYGTNVDIFAPGENIKTSTCFEKKDGKEDKSTILDHIYKADFTGTSGAAPIVSGSLALLWSLKPSMSAGELKSLVCNKTYEAIGVGADAGSTYPMLNVGAAVKVIVNEEETDPPSQPSDEGEWKQALEAKLYELLGSYDAPENCTFELYDADGDSVPEIYLCDAHFHAASGLGYSYQNGAYAQMGTFSEYGTIPYNPEHHIFKCVYVGMGAQSYTIKKISGGVLSDEAAYSSHDMTVSGGNEIIYNINGVETSQTEYEKLYSYYDSLEWINLGEKYALTAPNIKTALAELSGTPADTPDNGKTDKLYVPVSFKKVTSYPDYSDTNSMLYKLNWSAGKVRCDYEGDVKDFYFDADGKLTSGESSSPGGDSVYNYSFDYSGNTLLNGKIDGKYSTNGQQYDSSTSVFELNGNGRLKKTEYNDLTYGARISVKRNASGAATSASYSDSSTEGDTVYYYEDADHPNRLTKTELTDNDHNGTLVLNYGYDTKGRLISVSTETPFYFVWGGDAPVSADSFSVKLSYDANGHMTNAEYVLNRDGRETRDEVQITYTEATDAQYRAYHDMAACSFTPAVPDVYLPLCNSFFLIGFLLA